ncbi:hypothetical protein O181_028741 [Austropuccinia psidii MF-1]|uniref:Uncharacterized protein n=1 Tax=Austropuccinia psidii MF-1 TaxID=1389203 RepID=A0A9Q3H2N7_9BASI|nr:hypothetical protein [Austropuccinia psidii MF-1]
MLPTLQSKVLQVPSLLFWEESLPMSRSTNSHCMKILVEYKRWAIWTTGSRKRDLQRWTNVGGYIPTGGRPINSSSEIPISRINNQGKVKRIRRIPGFPTNPDSEGSDELNVE